MNTETPLVTRMSTYNHEKFIARFIEGSDAKDEFSLS